MHPILITGAPRSGKSTLGDILMDNSAFCYVSESKVKTLWKYGIFNFLKRDLLGFQRPSNIESYPALGRLISDSTKSYLDASMEHVFHLKDVHEVLPNAKLIFVIRSPIDVVVELSNAWHADITSQAVKQKLHYRPSLMEVSYSAFRLFSNLIFKRLFGRKLFFGPLHRKLLCKPFSTSPLEMAITQLELTYDALEDAIYANKSGFMKIVCFEHLVSNPKATMDDLLSWLFPAYSDFNFDFPKHLSVQHLNSEPPKDLEESLKERLQQLAIRHNFLQVHK